jgi:DNA-directed RNA polymerase specialized sigma24 family protein
MTHAKIENDDFTGFVRVAEPRLCLALTAAFGLQCAQEATSETLAFAWENWDRVSQSPNPIGFLFGVGRNKAKGIIRRGSRAHFPPVEADNLPWVEPHLPAALSRLSERQRQVVMLLHCFDWTLTEVAELMGLSKGTVQTHDRRGLARLRRDLGVGQ